MTEYDLLIEGALLHDIGKVVYRTGRNTNHSQLGYEFAKEELNIKNEIILNSIRYHHKDLLEHAEIDNNNLSYITYIADNISSAIDRRKKDTSGSKFEKYTSMKSVFGMIAQKEMTFPTGALEEEILLPKEEDRKYDKSFYQKMLSQIKEDLSYGRNIQTLLNVLEKYMTFIPSSTDISQVTDINLFEHSKLTAAVAGCIYYYLPQDTDYKKKLLRNSSKFYKENTFLFVRMDLEGLKDFVTDIHGTESILKNLRGRNFYIHMLLQNIIDTLLEDMGLCSVNHLFQEGQSVYLLVPNTKKVKETIESFERKINQWLLEQFQTDLFLSMVYRECSSNDLSDNPNGTYSLLLKELSAIYEKKISHCYSPKQILELNQKEIWYSDRECKRCHRSHKLNEENLCPICQGLEILSKEYLEEDVFYISKKEGGIPIYPNRTLNTRGEKAVRIYARDSMGQNRLWENSYQSENTIHQLVKEGIGMPYLGAAIIKIDRLRETFFHGFPKGYASLSRWTMFSKSINRFMKYHVNHLLKNGKYFMDKLSDIRHASVIYSDEEELFIVGAWNDIIEFVADFESHFRQYTGRSLPLSVSYSIFKESYPIRYIFNALQSLMNYSQEGNHITLFQKENIFSWEEFHNIINKKFRTVSAFFNTSEQFGKTNIYHILNYMRNIDEDVINLPRFLYTVSRLKTTDNSLEYGRFASCLYQWVKNKEERNQAIIAFYLYIYLKRGEEKNDT